MRSPMQVMMDNLNQLENDKALEDMVFELYAADATFEDPIQRVRGRKAIVGMYQDLVKIFPELSAVMKREVRTEHAHVAEWDMTFKSKFWPKAITISGTTWLEVDHKGMILSIYFHDPAGIRLEITTPLDKEWNRHTDKGYADLKLWLDCKEKAKAEGKDVPTELIRMIQEVRKRYD